MKFKENILDIIFGTLFIAGALLLFWSMIIKVKDPESSKLLKWLAFILIIPNGVNSIIYLFNRRNSGKKITS